MRKNASHVKGRQVPISRKVKNVIRSHIMRCMGALGVVLWPLREMSLQNAVRRKACDNNKGKSSHFLFTIQQKYVSVCETRAW
jgi:hypothetical protein